MQSRWQQAIRLDRPIEASRDQPAGRPRRADLPVGDTLLSLLRQLRAGYTQRPVHFPSTIVLCKVWHDGESDPLNEGLRQLDKYLAGLGLDTGWLVIFDRRAGQPRIAERTTASTATSPGGRLITIIRA